MYNNDVFTTVMIIYIVNKLLVNKEKENVHIIETIAVMLCINHNSSKCNTKWIDVKIYC